MNDQVEIFYAFYSLVTVLYCEEHQAFCYIAREIANQKRIVVVFR